jgi:uncharacterized protein (TIGR02246 family)
MTPALSKTKVTRPKVSIIEREEDKMRTLKLCLLILLVAGCFTTAIAAETTASDEAAIKKTIDSYVKAFNDGNAKALAEHWTNDGSFMAPTGEELKGREKLEASFKEFLNENKGIKLEVKPVAIYVQSPKEAIEEGVAITTRTDEEPSLTRYVAAYVKKNGNWKISKLREVMPMGESPHHEKLKPLDWMVGGWLDEDATGALETTCHWSANGNFLVRSFLLKIDGVPALGGKQIIGWDPASQQIRSWVFDSNGGFGEGQWTQQGDSWYVKSTIVLNTGEKASSINIITPVDENSFTWKSTSREVAGEMLPNTTTITVVRNPADSTEKPSGKE